MSETPLSLLAHRFPQLYVAPAADAQEKHRLASARGVVIPNANLDHFEQSDKDELRMVDTPAGPVEVLYLANRDDFETFLQIVGHKAAPVSIARTIGAITYSGLPDWGAVKKAHDAYLAAGGDDWSSEFRRLARKPGAFRAQLIAISNGPYSNIDAALTPFDGGEWLDVSREIRLHHECAHVVCRRLMPNDILPVWDEVTADVTGLICATRRYDADLAGLFLGVSTNGYTGGRLQEYVDEERRPHLDDMAQEIWSAMQQIEAQSQSIAPQDAFNFLLELKRHPLIAY